MNVYRSWNAAASDNHLWQLLHVIFFGNSENFSIHNARSSHAIIKNKENKHTEENVFIGNSIDWRETFKRAYKGNNELFAGNPNIFRLLSIRCFYLFINLSKWHTRSIAKNVNIWKDPFLHSLLLYMVEAMMFKCHLDIFKCSGWLTSLSLDPCGIHLCWLLYVIEMMEIQNLCTLPSILYWSNILLCTNSISQ